LRVIATGRHRDHGGLPSGMGLFRKRPAAPAPAAAPPATVAESLDTLVHSAPAASNARTVTAAPTGS